MDLTLIRKLIEAYKLWQEYLPHFPKTSRYSLGVKIDRYFVKIIELTLSASHLGGKPKLAYVKKASQKLDLLKVFLKISWEIRALDNKKYATLSTKLDEIGRMIGGWIRQIKEKLPL